MHTYYLMFTIFWVRFIINKYNDVSWYSLCIRLWIKKKNELNGWMLTLNCIKNEQDKYFKQLVVFS